MKNEIEPRIRCLVDALNETGLLQTFSSCQGHFGEEHDPDDLTDRTKAEVRADLRRSVLEPDVEDLVLHVLSDHMDGGRKWEATLTIWKQYVADPREAGAVQPLESFFVFDLRPFDPGVSDEEKRRVVDKLIAETTASVRQHTLGRQKKS